MRETTTFSLKEILSALDLPKSSTAEADVVDGQLVGISVTYGVTILTGDFVTPSIAILNLLKKMEDKREL